MVAAGRQMLGETDPVRPPFFFFMTPSLLTMTLLLSSLQINCAPGTIRGVCIDIKWSEGVCVCLHMHSLLLQYCMSWQ